MLAPIKPRTTTTTVHCISRGNAQPFCLWSDGFRVLAAGTHFRYGTIWWTPGGQSGDANVAQFNLRLAYRRDYEWGSLFHEAWSNESSTDYSVNSPIWYTDPPGGEKEVDLRFQFPDPASGSIESEYVDSGNYHILLPYGVEPVSNRTACISFARRVELGHGHYPGFTDLLIHELGLLQDAVFGIQELPIPQTDESANSGYLVTGAALKDTDDTIILYKGENGRICENHLDDGISPVCTGAVGETSKPCVKFINLPSPYSENYPSADSLDDESDLKLHKDAVRVDKDGNTGCCKVGNR